MYYARNIFLGSGLILNASFGSFNYESAEAHHTSSSGFLTEWYVVVRVRGYILSDLDVVHPFQNGEPVTDAGYSHLF